MALGLTACVPGFGRRPASSGALERLPVLLVLDGDPQPPSDAARIADALSRRIDRPVVLAPESTVDADVLAARLRTRYGRTPAGSWANDRCAPGQAAVQALAHDTNAHYRLVLRRRSATRPPTLDERDDVSVVRRTAARVLGGIGLADADETHEERLDGELIATTFGRHVRTRRLAIRDHARTVAPIGRAGLDVPAAVARAIEPLRTPPYPLWDGLARHLLARGCSLAALAVYDARLQHRRESRDVLRAALGPARDPAAVPTGTATATPAGAVPPSADDPAARISCKALCEMHMVELCNNDRELWSRHRVPWETTPCGQMRLEPFLRECYQRQWLTGTFQEACIMPCEHASDGRARLLHLLQGEGCTRVPSS